MNQKPCNFGRFLIWIVEVVNHGVGDDDVCRYEERGEGVIDAWGKIMELLVEYIL